MHVRVEVCVSSVDEAMAAAAFGVDSVEVCTWLACGGLTPGPALVEAVRERTQNTGLQRRVLVRPGPAGFVYNDVERRMILRDPQLLIAADPTAGLVVGALTADGEVDLALMRDLAHALPGRELTFHRAIDHAKDPPGAAERLRGSGVQRILSSGGKTLAVDGASTLREMVSRSGQDLWVAAAGGINAQNVVQVVETSGVQEVHFAAQRPVGGAVTGAAMSSAHAGINFATEPDKAKIEGVLNALVKAGLR